MYPAFTNSAQGLLNIFSYTRHIRIIIPQFSLTNFFNVLQKCFNVGCISMCSKNIK